MKRIFSNSEVPHLWAHQTQESARNGNGSLYFEGKTIYSYGTHFPIARFVDNSRGETAVLFTIREHSNTTAKHKNDTRSAIRHMSPVFNVPLYNTSIASPIPEYIASYRERIKTVSELVARSRVVRTREYRFSHLVALVNEANSCCEFFDQSERFSVPSDLDSLKADLARIAADENRAAEEIAKRITAENAELVAQWKAGDSVSLPWNLTETYLRIEGGEVVTSRGARVPVSHAITGLSLVRRIKAAGRNYVRNGHTVHLGHYAIDRIDSQGNLTVGCHHLTYAEIERIAPQLESESCETTRRAS